jgi:hypothetical protein
MYSYISKKINKKMNEIKNTIKNKKPVIKNKIKKNKYLLSFFMSKNKSGYSHNEKYYHKSHFNLYISKSGIHNAGSGVFTKDFIEKDSLIDEYYGDYNESLPGGEYFFRIDEEGGINAIDMPRCYMAMLNDSDYRPKSKRGLRNFIEHCFVNNCYFKVEIENIDFGFLIRMLRTPERTTNNG